MCIAEKDTAIGGYFGLELPVRNDFSSFLKFNSARSALKVVLASSNAKRIWIPALSCKAISDTVESLELDLHYYSITSDFSVDPCLDIHADDLILLIDYFGLNRKIIEKELKRFGKHKCIVDCSQAFYASSTDALATFWSPRKFFGVPDGGLLQTKNLAINMEIQKDESSLSRMSHLLERFSHTAEKGYENFVKAELSIASMPTLRMSDMTERLLKSLDLPTAKLQRQRNFNYLHSKLYKFNRLKMSELVDQTPLCYPFLPTLHTKSRLELANERIFTPCYWPETLARISDDCFERDIVTNAIFIPCDQRYSQADMDSVVKALDLKNGDSKNADS